MDNQYIFETCFSHRERYDTFTSDLDQLNVPRVRTAVGSRDFSVAAPRLWNELPLEIRSVKTQISFRKKLKTYFFGQAFPS